MKSTDISRLETTAEWSAAITKALHEGAEMAIKENEELSLSTVAKPSEKLSSQKLSSLANFILFSQREFLLSLSNDLSRGNISFSQFYLLSYLSVSPEMAIRDIARKMGHSIGAAAGLVDRMEKLGYVERAHAADNHRKVTVRITSKGMELVAKLRDALQSRVAEAMDEYETRDEAGFLASAGRLADSAAAFLDGVDLQFCK